MEGLEDDFPFQLGDCRFHLNFPGCFPFLYHLLKKSRRSLSEMLFDGSEKSDKPIPSRCKTKHGGINSAMKKN